MRLLHTSDWHIGRTFHGHSTDEHLRTVLAALAEAVTEHHIDVVLVAGDIFDSSTPKADAFTMFNEAVIAIREAGATVVLTSGNHDGPARLGHMATFAALGGVHVRTDLTAIAEPVTLTDEHGPVHLYGIPYLHPGFLAGAYQDFKGNTHGEALAFAMALVRSDAAARGGRFIVASHCFTTNAHATQEDTGTTEERDIIRGGLDLVPVSVFDGADYVALGHIHGRITLSDHIRYCGAPLRFSFGEKNKPRGAWIVDLDAQGLANVEWLDFPIPRDVSRLTGTINELLATGAYQAATDHWVDITLTDDTMPLDAMRRCQTKFPHAVTLTHRPSSIAPSSDATYAERIVGKSDIEIIQEFLAFVRNGDGPSDLEKEMVVDSLAVIDAKESSR